MSVCSVDGCGRKDQARGYCGSHYAKWRRWGDPLAVKKKGRLKHYCVLSGCESPVSAHGYCSKHAQRLRKSGSVELSGTQRGEPLTFLHEHVAYKETCCVIWPFALGKAGYGSLRVNGKTKNAPRYICELTHGAPTFQGAEAAHSCGNRACINPVHLRWATSAQNNADKVEHGTIRDGDTLPSAKLSAETVRLIRNSDLPSTELAKMLGCSSTVVSKARRRKTWKHVA